MGIAQLSLSDLTLTEEEMAQRMVQLRFRILGVFHRATEPDPRRHVVYRGSERRRGAFRSSGNTIVGCGEGKIGELAWYVARQTDRSNPILTLADIPAVVVRNSNEKLLRRRLAELRHQLITSTLCQMWKTHEIYFMDGLGTWQTDQKYVDEYVAWRNTARSIRRPAFRNDRSFHGRVRSQVERRGTAPGTSVGDSRNARLAS